MALCQSAPYFINRNTQIFRQCSTFCISLQKLRYASSLSLRTMKGSDFQAARAPVFARTSSLTQTTLPQSWSQQAIPGLHHISTMPHNVQKSVYINPTVTKEVRLILTPRRAPAQKPIRPAPKGIKSKQRHDSDPQPPSKASGGVPNPTQHYICQSLLNPITLPEPRRILIIMDLNGTLLHRPNKKRPFNFVQRPHAKEFMDYCLETFYVAIWSSARPENVNKMVAQLLTPEQHAKCLLIWARDQFGLSPSDYDARVQVYKRLTSVWAQPRIMASHPLADSGGRWDQTNTILVDDSMEKGRSEPFNILQIPEFSGLKDEPTHVLPQVHDYLNSLCYQGDVSRFVRQNPFKLDPSYGLQH